MRVRTSIPMMRQGLAAPQRGEEGIVLITTMVILFIMTVLGVGAVAVTALENRIAGFQRTGESSTSAAESCVGTSVNSQQSAPAGQSTLDPEHRAFRSAGARVDRRNMDQAAWRRYKPTTLVAYSRSYQSGCGAAQSAMGPFYCPTDTRIISIRDFFNDLSQRFQAPGDFAMAYVIAHEVGHHVQDLQGTLEQAHNLQARASEAEGNAVQVRS